MAESILVVEDDPTLARAVARNLEARGYTTHSAMTVADANEAIARDRPALVVLDIELPDGSGWEVPRGPRGDGRRDVPAIVMSASRPNQRPANELRVTGVLEKPFPMESLLRLVARCCGSFAPRTPVDPDEEG